MSFILDELDDKLAKVRATLDASDLPHKTAVTVTDDGRKALGAKSLRAGAIIIYPFPGQEFPAPGVTILTWTIGVVAQGETGRESAGRVQELIDVIADAGVIRWRDRANPTDFALPDQSSVPGYAITHIEEHRR